MKKTSVPFLAIGVFIVGIAAIAAGLALANRPNVNPDQTRADEPTLTPTPIATTTQTATPTTAAAVCGNGTVELGEQCDDNNLTNGDGCNSLCRIDSVDCTPLIETVDVVIPASPAGSCDWSRGEAAGRAKGFNTVSTTVSTAGICSLSNLTIRNNPDTTFRYDDSFLITMNDIILLASHRALYDVYPQQGPFRIFNGVNTMNGTRTPNNNQSNQYKCLNSDCRVPISQQRGTFSLGTFSDEIQDQIFSRLSSGSEITFSTVATGDDNRSIDCAVPAITIQVEVETVPESCNCPALTSFCGDGVIDAGEQCDGGLSTGQPCNPAAGTSCQWCTSQCTIAYEAVDATAPPTPSPSSVAELPDTALFGETADLILLGGMLLMAGVWSYVLGIHTQIGRTISYLAGEPQRISDSMHKKKKTTLEKSILEDNP
ncbi:MAG: hypothetical protein TR69_WS6001000235 [candidate division WS6 bacterium OLB20]|uniref:DUF4215 domain-containing protein n=1 Tax=candidate division WS6 bacterium OLB20 TaxID=1617426 RepID=A0A136M0C8_9BACT|nr:MAG: hypothetical protein TR69_WS6001000235 [candidate division WS6 bacterium OLB20]